MLVAGWVGGFDPAAFTQGAAGAGPGEVGQDGLAGVHARNDVFHVKSRALKGLMGAAILATVAGTPGYCTAKFRTDRFHCG